jgi:hypothetical protein
MSLEKAYRRLGYTPDWVSLGIVSEDYVLKQYKTIASSNDKHAEHYRTKGFYHYLNSKTTFTNQEVEAIFSLKDKGPDNYNLHENRIIELIHSQKLSDNQLNSLNKFPEVLEPPIQKQYFRVRLIRKIEALGIAECFKEIMETQGSSIHEYVLKIGELSHEHLVWLSESGLNKRLRNIAKQRLNSKRYRTL